MAVKEIYFQVYMYKATSFGNKIYLIFWTICEKMKEIYFGQSVKK